MNRRVSVVPSITPLAAGCWMALAADEEPDEETPHYPTRAAAAAARPGRGIVLIQRPAVCWTAAAACGYAFDADDIIEHHDSADELAQVLVDAGWKRGADDVYGCGADDCLPCASLPPPPETPTEFPGQQSLFGGTT